MLVIDEIDDEDDSLFMMFISSVVVGDDIEIDSESSSFGVFKDVFENVYYSNTQTEIKSWRLIFVLKKIDVYIILT